MVFAVIVKNCNLVVENKLQFNFKTMKHLLRFASVLFAAVAILFISAPFSNAQTYATVPYSTGFETGIDNSWTIWSSLPGGQVDTFPTGVLTWSTQTAYSHSGNYFMGMHYPTGGAYNTNQADLHMNLNGQSGLRISLWWAEWNDETEPQDGIYVSNDDGITFTKVLDLNGGSYTDLEWQHFDLSLDSINALYGLTFTSTYIIRLQQYDNYYFAGGNDGFLFDDISVYNTCGSASTISPVSCGPYTAPDGQFYNTSGNYIAVIPNAASCDSVITINLTINSSSSSSTVTVCDSYTAPDNQVYTTSGNYIAVIQNGAGCDSTISIDLTVNNSSSSSSSASACDSYLWIDSMTYTSSGIYSFTVVNAAGCDSIIELDLTINTSTASTLTETALDSYTLNGQTYTASGTYIQTIPNAAGCDSTITLNLTLDYTGLNELDKATIAIYPNPSTGVIHISGIDQNDNSLIIKLLDANGRLVKIMDRTKTDYDLSQIEKGIYYVSFTSDSDQKTIKLNLR